MSFAQSVAAIDVLPNEVLPSIFAFAIENQPTEEYTSSTVSPITISHTCRRWQQIALETGSLWTNIVLTFPASEKQLTRTSIWLSRSTTYPLNILLDFRDPDWDWEEEETHEFRWADMEAVLLLLLPAAARWRTVDLLTDTWAPIFVFLLHTRTVGPTLNRLERLHLARCNAYFARRGQVFEPSVLGQHLPLFGGEDAVVPRLREVTLTGVHIQWSAAPLANLTKLEFKYQAMDVMPTIAQFTQILAASPNLEALALVGHGPQFSSPTNVHAGSAYYPGTITLARLTQCTLGFVDVNDAMKLLALFGLPALCKLSLEDVSASLQHQPPDDIGVLLDWLVGAVFSSTVPISRLPLGQLHTLALHHLSAPSLTFSRLYAACGRLAVLRLYEVCDGAQKALGVEMPVIDANQIQADVLPRLDTLIVRGVDRDIFTSVVRARGTSLQDARFEEVAPIE
ncbi:hypothetical protein B0H19DRAFT_938022 [Mycena capillaripes]|nr:hypothetical protein B0H19DRAFT_938022 [Mycena capillaripes]